MPVHQQHEAARPGTAQLFVIRRRDSSRLPGVVLDLGDNKKESGSDTWGCWSPQSLMFPYLEQGALYNAINFNLSNRYSGYKANTSLIATRIASFLCPSSPLPEGHSSVLH